MTKAPVSLPIDDVTADVCRALRDVGVAVLAAPPGAGKTTRVPLVLMAEPWAQAKKLLVLEPRRIVARAAATRMAATLNEPLAVSIGLRARLSSQTSARVRVEVVTEGVFTRMILDDPELGDVCGVIFDEFHERSVDADLGLALALDARQSVRPDLRLLIMSATLDTQRIAALLDDAPSIVSDGRAYAVETRYLGRRAARVEDDVVDAVLRATTRDTGSMLVFLPGQGEITRVAEKLSARISDASIDIAPLYGALSPAAQDLAISPAKSGRRKIVLATSIAETSITIEGVRVVIDSGVARVPRFEPDVGVTRLETIRVSKAAADQRRGRAGRTEPGVCYRLWDDAETQGLMPFAQPEILNADLSGLLLDCADWGVIDLRRLRWLDLPSDGAIRATRSALQTLGALDPSGAITVQGRRLRALPLPPPLAHMVVCAADRGAANDAALIAAVLVERGIGGSDVDLDQRLSFFKRDRSPRAEDLKRLARGWARTAEGLQPARPAVRADPQPTTAELLALAYPERIAKSRGAAGQFLLANGRAGAIDQSHPLAHAPFIVVAELQGRAAATRILLATALDADAVDHIAPHRIESTDEIVFDTEARGVRARRSRRLGAITLAVEPRAIRPDDDVAGVLARGVAALGIDRLPWTKAQQQLRHRLAFLHATNADWPDLSDQALAANDAEWLVPHLVDKMKVSEITADDLSAALDTVLPWALRQKLELAAPTHFEAPTGNRHAVDYDGPGAPALHIRVQELFGLKVHPTIAGGRLPLTLNLLSPAHRPLQITRDLPGFWAGSWVAVRADMRGQYPKHVWPEDPANTQPTARAKPRGS